MVSHGSTVTSTPIASQPQLSIIATRLGTDQGAQYHVEYRVYNWRRLSSGRVIRGDGWGIMDLSVWCILSYAAWWAQDMNPIRCWNDFDPSEIAFVMFLGVATLFYVRACVSTTLYQSVIPLPGLGLQLSTTRGISLPHPAHPLSPERRLLSALSTSHTFVPLPEISTIIINEGLKRWSVRYYLAVVKRRAGGVVVAIDEIWAPVAVLREVYHGLRESLFDEYAKSQS